MFIYRQLVLSTGTFYTEAIMTKPGILALVWPKDPTQVGSGPYGMNVCFPTLGNGVHMFYVIHSHQGEEELLDVGKATPCNGACVNRTAIIKDFGEMPHRTSYNKRPILEVAMRYAYPIF